MKQTVSDHKAEVMQARKHMDDYCKTSVQRGQSTSKSQRASKRSQSPAFEVKGRV